jgi:hypothetical protein
MYNFTDVRIHFVLPRSYLVNGLPLRQRRRCSF